MNITLCINIFEDGSSNDMLSKPVSDDYKYLNSGDVIGIEYDEFIVSRKRIEIKSNSMFLYCDYHVDENQDAVENVVDRLQKQGFKK